MLQFFAISTLRNQPSDRRRYAGPRSTADMLGRRLHSGYALRCAELAILLRCTLGRLPGMLALIREDTTQSAS